MPATLETIKSEEKQTYHYPLKTNYREHIHSPEGVNGPVEHSMLMDMLKKMDVKELPEHSPGTLPNHENIRGKDYYK